MHNHEGLLLSWFNSKLQLWQQQSSCRKYLKKEPRAQAHIPAFKSSANGGSSCTHAGSRHCYFVGNTSGCHCLSCTSGRPSFATLSIFIFLLSCQHPHDSCIPTTYLYSATLNYKPRAFAQTPWHPPPPRPCAV
eukprot:1158241-Pelagomonas_calceolata.AAC.1